MRAGFIFIALLIYTSSFAQENDYPDFRSKKDLFKRIQEKDIRSDLSSFTMAGIDESVGKLSLKTMPVTEATATSISFAENNVNIKIIATPFEPLKHKLGYFDQEKKYLMKIDNKGYFGDYGKMPKTVIANVIVVIGRDTVSIPATAYNDLYNPIFSVNEKGAQKTNNKVYLSNDGKKMYIYMLKRESGGSYEVTWIFQDKKFLKRVVDYGFLP